MPYTIIDLSRVNPAGARTLSPDLTPVTAFKIGAGSMKREALQRSGGQLSQFIIIMLQQFYEHLPAFMAVSDVDSRMNSVDNAQQSDRLVLAHHQQSLSVSKRSSDVRTFAAVLPTRTSMSGIYR
jgi:hypothetical protein